jgi:hypothetical protein
LRKCDKMRYFYRKKYTHPQDVRQGRHWNSNYFNPKTKKKLKVLNFSPGLGKNPGNSKKPMGMRKTDVYREKWKKTGKMEKTGKISFFQNTCLKSMLNHWHIHNNGMFLWSKLSEKNFNF